MFQTLTWPSEPAVASRVPLAIDRGAEGGAVGAVDAASVRPVAGIPDRDAREDRTGNGRAVSTGSKIDAAEEGRMA